MVFGLMVVLLSCFAVAEVSSSVRHDFYISDGVGVDGAGEGAGGVEGAGGEVRGVEEGFCSRDALYWITGIFIFIVVAAIYRKQIERVFGRKK